MNHIIKKRRVQLKGLEKELKRALILYTAKLDPTTFPGLVTFFDFDNHTKIVLTNNIAYIGSGNFSEESAGNWETGVLIKDASLIELIIDNWVPIIEGEAIRYYGDEISRLIVVYSLLLSRFDDAVKEFDREVNNYGIVDKHFSASYGEKDLITLLGLARGIQEEIQNLENINGLEELTEYLDSEMVDKIEELFTYDDPITDIVCFSQMRCAENYLGEQMVHNEEMDDAAQEASQKAYEYHYDARGVAEDEITEVLEKLDSIRSALRNIISDLGTIRSLQDSIDNT